MLFIRNRTLLLARPNGHILPARVHSGKTLQTPFQSAEEADSKNPYAP
jgi:hypothetical protein